MRNLVRVFFCWASLGVGSAHALDCANAMTTPEINECAAIEKDIVEKRLNDKYKEVLASLDSRAASDKDNVSKAKAKLIEAQRAWIKFREADCEAIYNLNASGTIRTVIWISCMQSHAERRIDDLAGFMSGG